MVKNICAKFGFFIFLFFLSCNRNFCKKENFYSVYQTRFDGSKSRNNAVESDLEIKQKVFSILCISDSLKRMLIVESGNATQSFYSRGLLFTYDDSMTYYFKIKNGQVIAGKGINGNTDLNKILTKVKEDFPNEKIKLDKDHDTFDAPIVNVIVYDFSMPQKFDMFNFPMVVWDRLHSQ